MQQRRISSRVAGQPRASEVLVISGRAIQRSRVLGLIGVSGAIAGCIPGPSLTKSEIRSLERMSYSIGLTTKDKSQELFEISALRAGVADAPRIIYIHGTPGDATNFADYILDPIEGHESIAIDRPGFGRTAPRSPVTSFEEQAKAIEPLLVERNGRWPILVGHSLGGPIAARVAAEHPDRVGGIVILAGSLDPELENPRWFNYLAGVWPFSAAIGRTMRTSNHEIMAAAEETRELDGLLSRVQSPVVIVHGTKDRLVPVANVDYMRREFAHIDEVTVTIIEDEGHFLPWSREELVRQSITSVIVAK